MAAPLAQISDPLNQLAAIAGIGPDLFQAPMLALQPQEERFRTIPILLVGRMNPYFQNQAERIHQNMPFSASYFLARIVAVKPPLSVVLTL